MHRYFTTQSVANATSILEMSSKPVLRGAFEGMFDIAEARECQMRDG
jgi:hypothetical protein